MNTPLVADVNPKSPRILRLTEVLQRTGFRKTKIYEMQADGTFPRSIKIGERAVGWIEKEVNDWVDYQIQAGRAEESLSAAATTPSHSTVVSRDRRRSRSLTLGAAATPSAR